MWLSDTIKHLDTLALSAARDSAAISVGGRYAISISTFPSVYNKDAPRPVRFMGVLENGVQEARI